MNTKYYISRIEYDDESSTLEIEWTIDVVWNFFDVPRIQYVALLNSSDKEEYYRQHIMNNFKNRQKWRSFDELMKICAEVVIPPKNNSGQKWNILVIQTKGNFYENVKIQ